MTGPILICECGLGYVAISGRPPGCPRCLAIEGFVKRITQIQVQVRWMGMHGERAPYVDEKTERRRAQYRASKARAKARRGLVAA